MGEKKQNNMKDSNSQVIVPLCDLKSDPNPNDPLNRYAAQLQVDDITKFDQTVRMTLKGGKHLHGQDQHGDVYTKFTKFV